MLEAIDLSSHPWAYSISAFPGTELDEIAIMRVDGFRWVSGG